MVEDAEPLDAIGGERDELSTKRYVEDYNGNAK
jgi:hypothetical protein